MVDCAMTIFVSADLSMEESSEPINPSKVAWEVVHKVTDLVARWYRAPETLTSVETKIPDQVFIVFGLIARYL